jgi:hypothetical protein
VSDCQVQSSEAIVSVTLLSNSEKRKTEALSLSWKKALSNLLGGVSLFKPYSISAGNSRILRKKTMLIIDPAPGRGRSQGGQRIKPSFLPKING